MLSSGAIGVAAAIVPCFRPIQGNFGFAAFWMMVGVLALGVAYFLVRRQALRDREPFWSPPTRRITEALLPGFIAGCAVGVFLIVFHQKLGVATWHCSVAWIILYGSALNAAGFFTPRGIGLFGRTLVLLGCALLFAYYLVPGDVTVAAHYVMGSVFGVLHLLYGFYLYFSERKRRV
ncbi:MAG TPA: hypothetical protein VNT99_15745 [Methylomirabilota bacterium]|nr:hypothetical protein [Methylomirabilota bacterium]